MIPTLLQSSAAIGGVFVPVLGVVSTMVLAALTFGRTRWIVLAASPIIVLAVFSWLLPSLGPVNLAARMYALYTVALAWYYPLLLLAGASFMYRATLNPYKDWAPATRVSGVGPVFKSERSAESWIDPSREPTQPPIMLPRLDRRELGSE